MAKKNKMPEAERELKIRLSAKDMERVLGALARQAGARKIDHKYTHRHYYDTSGLHLYKGGVSLRVQYKPGKGGRLGRYEQTVKFALPEAAPAVKGALFRKECKNALPSEKPDLSTVTDRGAKAVVKPFKGKKLVHIFTAETERRCFEMKSGGGKAEVAFDAVQMVLPGGRRHAYFEMEIELLSGSPKVIEDIYKKTKKLARSARISAMSKAQQGCRFYMRAR